MFDKTVRIFHKVNYYCSTKYCHLATCHVLTQHV